MLQFKLLTLHLLLLLGSPISLLAYEAADTSQHFLCRSHPTWSNDGVSSELCSNVTEYYVDKDVVLEGATKEYQVFDEKGVNWIDTMETCMNEKSRNRTIRNCKKNDGECENAVKEVLPEPRITNLYPSTDEPLMATVSFALSEEEARTVIDLKQCVQQYHPKQFEHRSFAYEGMEDTVEIRGGNDVTFLAGFLQLFAPGVASQVYQVGHIVWEAAGWGDIPYDDDEDEDDESPFPDPYECGIRTTEHLSYKGWGGLGRHGDTESLYTVLVSLVDPSAYEGGEYFLEPSTWEGNDSNARIVIKPNKLSAVVFLSEEMHGVQKILNGTREMFTTELWKYGDVAIGQLRPWLSNYERFMETGSYEEDGNDAGKEINEDVANDEL